MTTERNRQFSFWRTRFRYYTSFTLLSLSVGRRQSGFKTKIDPKECRTMRYSEFLNVKTTSNNVSPITVHNRSKVWSLVNKILTTHFFDIVVVRIHHPLTDSYCLLFSGVGSIVPLGWKWSQGYQPLKFMKKRDHLVSASNKLTLVFRTPMDPKYVSKRVF
jgi:hypothetical protein